MYSNNNVLYVQIKTCISKDMFISYFFYTYILLHWEMCLRPLIVIKRKVIKVILWPNLSFLHFFSGKTEMSYSIQRAFPYTFKGTVRLWVLIPYTFKGTVILWVLTAIFIFNLVWIIVSWHNKGLINNIIFEIKWKEENALVQKNFNKK